MVGTLYGAVTNTPGLGAANEALTSVFQKGSIPQIASGYACAYPLGVLGIIGATIAIRYICHISLEKEEEDLNVAEDDNPHAKPQHRRIFRLKLQRRITQTQPLNCFLQIIIILVRHREKTRINKRLDFFVAGERLDDRLWHSMHYTILHHSEIFFASNHCLYFLPAGLSSY